MNTENIQSEIVSTPAADTSFKLSVVDVLKSGVATGTINLIPMVIAVVLWLLTIWIPYINIGTTIAICTIPIQLSKGKLISPLFIFEARYRQYMGEFFLACGFISAGVTVASFFMVIPGIVLGFAWSQALFILLDKNVNPAEALTLSNKLTAGNKFRIFLSYIGLFLVTAILGWVFQLIPYVGAVLLFILLVIYNVSLLGIAGAVYGKLIEGKGLDI